jgi:hypothetical protein
MRAAARSLVALMLPVALAMSPARPCGAGQDWDIEVHGGAMISSNPTSGTSALPPPGAVITFPPPPPGAAASRVVPSWYFGDGASLLNQAVARLGVAIVPLDPVLESRFVERRSGASVGVRVGRALGDRFAAEFAFDEGFGPLALTPRSISGIEASRLSFLSTWNGLLNGPAGRAQTVSSNATTDDKRGGQLVTTGALLINLHRSARVKPYVALGAGLIATRGGAPSAQLIGNYHFTFPAVPPPIPTPPPALVIDQTDTVTIRTVVDTALTWVIGGGLKFAATKRWGVRLDVRDHLNRDPVRTTVAAAPATAPTTTAGTLTLFFSPSTPPLQFSTFSPSGSTLSGNPVVGFRTFGGTGIVNQVNVTAGLYWRF